MMVETEIPKRISYNVIEMKRFSVQDRMLVHLLCYFRAKESFVAPPAVTQQGIARMLYIERSNVPHAIRRLTRKSLVEDRIAHVEGEKRRRKVYFLTPLGYREALDIKRRMECLSVSVIIDGEEMERELGQLAKEIGIELLTLAQLMPRDRALTNEDLHKLAAIKGKRIRMLPPLPPLKWYYGREDIEEAILKGLDDPSVLAVVVYGIAGVGKTTLARHIVETHLEEDNVWWWRIREWDTPRSILSSLAEFLALDGRTHFKDYITSRKIIDVGEAARLFSAEIGKLHPILVLDDYHSVSAETISLLKALYDVASDGNVKLLLFGRERKPFYGRRDVVISNRVAELELRGLDQKSAQSLLESLHFAEEDYAAVFEATGGHPLAIEILHLTDPRQVQRNMDLNRFFYEEIFSKLSKEETETLNILSVFRTPIPWDALSVSSEEIFMLLERKAIVTATESGLYSIHDILDRIIYSTFPKEKRQQAHREAARYYGADFLDEEEKELLPEDEADLIECLHHLVQGGEYGHALRLIQLYGEEVLDRGYLQEYMVFLDSFRPETLDPEGESIILKLKGDILTIWGEWEEAEKLFHMAEEKTESQMMTGKIRNKLGVVKERLCKWDEAIEEYDNAIAIFESVGDKKGIAEAQRAMGIIFRKRGNYKEALRRYETSLQVFMELEDRKGLARVNNSIGVYYDNQGKSQTARDYFMKSLDYAREGGEKRIMGAAYNNIGETLKMENRCEEALEYYLLALDVQTELGERQGIAVSLGNVGDIYVRLGNLEKGIKNLEKSLKLAQEISDRYLEGAIFRDLALAYYETDEKRAGNYFNLALERFKDLNASTKIAQVEDDLARLYGKDE
ncbi:MAG: tetratricopeptide repeat protein [Thermoplasmata archaeon]|nr:tetratricopeptide repeat protein [Thermoplasmata archaeon]